jgi:hypothetical protein
VFTIVMKACGAELSQSLERLCFGLGGQGSIPGRDKRFSFLRSVKTGSGASPASYPVGTRGFSLEVKQPERETDHSPPSSSELYLHSPIRARGIMIN